MVNRYSGIQIKFSIPRPIALSFCAPISAFQEILFFINYQYGTEY